MRKRAIDKGPFKKYVTYLAYFRPPPHVTFGGFIPYPFPQPLRCAVTFSFSQNKKIEKMSRDTLGSPSLPMLHLVTLSCKPLAPKNVIYYLNGPQLSD